MKETDNVQELKASEVKLTYQTKIKASDRIVIRNPDDAAQVFFNHWDMDRIEHVEEMKILLLNRAHRVLGIAHLSLGGTTGTVTDLKVILQYAIKTHASCVIMAHNHPSGSLKPSEADVNITKRVYDSLALLDIQLLDHIIINAEKNFSSIE